MSRRSARVRSRSSGGCELRGCEIGDTGVGQIRKQLFDLGNRPDQSEFTRLGHTLSLEHGLVGRQPRVLGRAGGDAVPNALRVVGHANGQGRQNPGSSGGPNRPSSRRLVAASDL